MNRTRIAVGIVIAAALLGVYLYARESGSPTGLRTARVERGPLTATVSTTGTLNAVITVQVGTQISGQVRELFADFNSRVTKQQLIARIDPSGFEAKVSQARADVEAADANVLNQHAQVGRARADVSTAEANTANQRAQIDRAQADVENARASLAGGRAQTAKARVVLADAKRDLDRKNDLFHRGLVSRSERETSQAAHDSAEAQLEANRAQEEALSSAIRSALGQFASSRAQEQATVAGIEAAKAQLRVIEAQLRAAQASVRQKRAALQQALVDLEHTSIRSPVDGIVVSRNVDVGQTVAASLQAPTLFTIAQDLTRMQVDANVDEADIGRVDVGQNATFTVDSFRGRTFSGRVTQVRKAARVVQNVVTYNVVVSVANPDGKLLPGLTANVRIVVASRPSVLKVPNIALRFRPSADRDEGEPARGRGALVGTSQASVDETRGQLVRELKLSQDQDRALLPILEERRQRSVGVERLQPQQRRAAALALREEIRVKIRALLNREQQTVFDQLPIGQPTASGTDGRPGTVWVSDQLGSLSPVPIVLGITDGSFTEVLEGDLKEGQEVVVSASMPAGSEGAPAGSGPRLRM
jgi:HlyD family secretion protein